MIEGLTNIAVIKENINKSSLDEDVKTYLLSQLQRLESNLRMNQELEDEFIKSRLTSEVYLVRKNLLITDRVRIKDNIHNNITKNVMKKLRGDDVGLLSTLRKAINDNSAWISILLTLSKILLKL